MSTKRLGLALGGGSARGMAHIGVLEVLEREQIPISCLAGTSAGSLVGVAYAAGVRGPALLDVALSMRWHHVARPTLSRQGLVSFARLEKFLVSQMGDCTFADLELPYAAVATDLVSGEPVVLRQGRLARAVRASCSVPGIVPPVEIDGRMLVDGAATNNLPISVARDLGADVVVAVGLSMSPPYRPRGMLSIAVAAMDILLLRAGDDTASADVYLAVPVWGPGSLLRLSHCRELMALGRQAAETALPAICAALEN